MKGLETTMETKKFCQAPAINNSGKGYRPKGWKNYGSMIFDGYLLQKLCELCGERHFSAFKLLLFLIGNADGFRIAEKTVLERCNIKRRSYRQARKFLKENKIILVHDGIIEVNFQAIYEFVGEEEPEEKPVEAPVEAQKEYKDMDDYFAHSAW